MQARVNRTSSILTLFGILTALMLVPLNPASAAEPLPPNTYDVEVDGVDVQVVVREDGTDETSTSDEAYTVELQRNDDGEVLDTFTVTAPNGDVYEVEIEIDDESDLYFAKVTLEERGEDEDEEDAEEASTEEEDDDAEDADSTHGELVSTVARCAPSGAVANAFGWPSHGTIVSAAASGTELDAAITDPETGETTPIEADLSTLEGAEAFCAMVEELLGTPEEQREALQALREEERAEREAAREEQRAEREAAREEQRAERDAARGADDTEAGADGEDGGDDAPKGNNGRGNGNRNG